MVPESSPVRFFTRRERVAVLDGGVGRRCRAAAFLRAASGADVGAARCCVETIGVRTVTHHTHHNTMNITTEHTHFNISVFWECVCVCVCVGLYPGPTGLFLTQFLMQTETC